MTVDRAVASQGAPFFEDLRVGDVVEEAPSITLTDGLAALHQAILGDRLRLALDAPLSRAVTGSPSPLAHPALVCDVAIGQSTLVTQRVIANLFYRGLVLRRAPVIGDTLATTTEVVALRQNTLREGRPATGLAALRIRTTDQDGERVLDFWRCAMLPLRDRDARTGHADDLDAIPATLDAGALEAAAAGWRLDRFRAAVKGPHGDALVPGSTLHAAGGDVVASATELARLSLNIAVAHHDEGATGAGKRLVYGGHTIGIAAAQATRMLPNLVTILAWHGCDHLAPVHEGDTLHSSLEIEGVRPLADGHLVDLRSQVEKAGGTAVLDWRFVALMA